MNKNNVIWMVAILIVVVLGLYWYMPSSSTYQNQAPVVNNQVTNIVPSTINSTEISVVNNKFEPTPLTVKAGTIVTWTNNDTVPHTVTSDSGATLSSPRLAPGEKFSYTFTTAGTYDYHCTVHPMMKGGIVVQ